MKVEIPNFSVFIHLHIFQPQSQCAEMHLEGSKFPIVPIILRKTDLKVNWKAEEYTGLLSSRGAAFAHGKPAVHLSLQIILSQKYRFERPAVYTGGGPGFASRGAAVRIFHQNSFLPASHDLPSIFRYSYYRMCCYFTLKAVFRIRDIVIRILILGSIH